ncbi:MAG: peptidylprolyl isomerase [Desulfobulbaceae bacterium]|nr:peptidylprolyl isomerase [Candidatus Kapabacteria bacterium]MBS3998984.1 peptidylprolyl isomerase [Desulfobulbaceae bacterium]
MRLLVLSIFFISVMINIAHTQPKAGESLDRIVAIVGEDVVMKSDIDGQIGALMQYDKNLDINDKTLRKQILDGLIDQFLMVYKAKQDSIVISDEEVTQRMEMHLQTEVRRFGSEQRVEQVYGMSIPRIKNEIKEKIRHSLLVQNLLSVKFSEVKVTQKEVQDFYNQNSDSIPEMPAAYELYHIVKNVKSDDDTKKASFDFAVKLRDSLLNGADFADFAKRYSGDPGTAEDGGELGWFERGKLFPEFEKAAFKLAVNEISLPIETPFGFHIIQTLDKRPEAVKTRHILLKFAQSNEDKQKAIDFLNDLKKKIEEGSDFEELAKLYSDDKETRGFGGFLGKLPYEDIPEKLRSIVTSLPDGALSEPMLYVSDPTKESYHIIYKKKFHVVHKANLNDDFNEIEQYAIESKKRKLYAEFLQNLRKVMHWEIVSDY